VKVDRFKKRIWSHIFLRQSTYIVNLDHNFLFCSKNGNPVTGTNLCKMVTLTTYRLTGKRMNPHLFRDSVVTYSRIFSPDVNLFPLLCHSRMQSDDRYHFRVDFDLMMKNRGPFGKMVIFREINCWELVRYLRENGATDHELESLALLMGWWTIT